MVIHEIPFIQRWISFCIKGQDSFSWAGLAKNTIDAFPVVKENHPQVLVMGITSLEPDQLDPIRRFLQTFPHIQFIACSGFKDEKVHKQLSDMGFADHLLQPFTSVQLLKSIQSVVPPTYLDAGLGLQQGQGI